MNDKQKDIALKMAVARARMSMDFPECKNYEELKKELGELLSAFDAAADAPKRKYTVDDIAKYRLPDGDWCIKCRGYGWTFNGWNSYGAYNPLTELAASIIYAGLVATGNVPEVGE